MTRKCVTDGQFGQVSRRADEVKRRVDEGSVPFSRAMKGLQLIAEGQDLALSDPAALIMELDGFKRLPLDPERPLESWRQVLNIGRHNWSELLATLFDEPEPWELDCSEVWYTFEVPGRMVWPLEMVGLMMTRRAMPFSLRMGLALAQEGELEGLYCPIPIIGSTRERSDLNLYEPCLTHRGGSRCVDVGSDFRRRWDQDSKFPCFRRL